MSALLQVEFDPELADANSADAGNFAGGDPFIEGLPVRANTLLMGLA